MRKEVDVESKRNIGVICNKTQLLWYQSFIKSIKREFKRVFTPELKLRPLGVKI